MRCDTLRCVARAADVVAVELGNPIKKLNRQSLLYPQLILAPYYTISHSLTLSLSMTISLLVARIKQLCGRSSNGCRFMNYAFYPEGNFCVQN